MTAMTLEVTARLFLWVSFSDLALDRNGLYDRFYPRLAIEHHPDPDRTDLLILGGSVLYADTLTSPWRDRPVEMTFCGLPGYLDTTRYNVLNLAYPGYNSMDSRIQFEQVADRGFEAVFVYHGINDARTNNVAIGDFDPMYRHIEFYDDLAVLRAHPEHRAWATPFVVHWLVHSIRARDRTYIPKEVFWGLLHGDPEPFIAPGDSIRSDVVLHDNLTAIITKAHKLQIRPVLMSYAWHLPDHYTLDGFQSGDLSGDYASAIYETELYGDPDNVRKALIRHDDVVRDLARTLHVPFIELRSGLPRDSTMYEDVCHLTPDACRIMMGRLDSALTSGAP